MWGACLPKKGIDVLARALAKVPTPDIRIAGTGPEESFMSLAAPVQRLGALNGDQVRQEMSRAMALVLLGIWYENFPRTLLRHLVVACQ